MISAVLFLAVGAAGCAAVILAIFTMVDVYYLSGARAIADDGLPRGAAAPAWSLPAASGRPLHSPPRERALQLIVFTDHSLKSFPAVAGALRALAAAAPELEIVVLARDRSGLTEPVLGALGLGHLPVAAGPPALYGKYNVRVMPFVVFVDSAGQVRASSLVNHAWQLERLWRLARVEPDRSDVRAVPGLRRHAAMRG